MPKLTLTFDAVPPGLNGEDGLMRAHWAEYRVMRDTWVWLMRAVIKDWDGVMIPRCRITWTLRVIHLRDWDNACASFKVVGDALQTLGIIKDDSPQVILEFIPKQERTVHYDEQGCMVEIEPI